MSILLLRVAATWFLPGLGLLALPDGPTPNLNGYDLHTALPVEATLPNGERIAAIATVEEVTRPDTPGTQARGILLDFGSAVELSLGTNIWLAQTSLSADGIHP